MRRFVNDFQMWVERERSVFFFRFAAILTLSVGVYLHLTHLHVGREVFLEYVLTPGLHVSLAVPMTYAAIAGWAGFKRVRFSGIGERVGYLVLISYFSVSIPIHAQTLVTGRIDYLIRAFPQGFSLLILPVMIVIIIFIRTLRFDDARGAISAHRLAFAFGSTRYRQALRQRGDSV